MIRDIWDEIEDDVFRKEEDDATGRPAKPFTTISARDLMMLELPEQVHIWGKGIITRGQLTAIVGQGGTGKSRISLQVAVEECAGIAPLGFEHCGTKQANRWLFVGTENGIHRLQKEFMLMVRSYPAEVRDNILDSIFFHYLKEDDDMDILLREDNVGRWSAMLDAVKPTVVVADPFGDIHPGDINKPAEVRATVRAFMRVCRRHNPEMAMVIIHHARAGKTNISGAVGWDQGAFSLGAKDITTMARVQVNVTFTDPDDWSKILLSLGKANDMERFEPRGFLLNQRTMKYEADPNFDLETWKADLDGKRSPATKLSVAQVLDYIIKNGGPKAEGKRNWEMNLGRSFGVSDKTVRTKIKTAFDLGYLVTSKTGDFRVTDKYRAHQDLEEDGV